MRVLAVAAGMGTRLRMGAKHLAMLWGRPLLYYPLRVATSIAGGEPLVVVQSFYVEETRAALRENGLDANVYASFCPHCENGYSLLLGLSYARSPVLLTVADHVYEPCLVERLVKGCPEEAGVCVAGDRSPSLVDIEEATKIRVEDNSIIFSKRLAEYDYVDTGVFLIRDWEGLLRRFGHRVDLTMNDLWSEYSAAGGRVEVVDVTGCRWADVDTEQDFYAFLSGPRRSLIEELLDRLAG